MLNHMTLKIIGYIFYFAKISPYSFQNKYSDNDYKSIDDYYSKYNYYSDLFVKNDNIRIWSFHSGILLQRIILISFKNQYCLCLLNNKYLSVGCCNNNMLLVDYQKGVLIQTFHEHKDSILKIVKINHAKYGECLITQGMGNDQIKIWNIQNEEKRKRIYISILHFSTISCSVYFFSIFNKINK